MPTPAPDRPFLITRPDQAEAIVSPVRQEILDAVAAAGRDAGCTVADLARLLARPADALYYHVDTLARLGLLIPREPRREGRRTAAAYDVPGRPLRIEYGARIPHDTLSRVITAAIRLALRDYRHAVEHRPAALRPPRRTVYAGRVKGWVDAADLPEVVALLDRLTALVQHGAPAPGREPLALTYILAPARTSPRAPSPGTEPAPARANARRRPARRAGRTESRS